MAGSDLWFTELWVGCGPGHSECLGMPGLGAWGPWEQASPEGPGRASQGHSGPMPGR